MESLTKLSLLLLLLFNIICIILSMDTFYEKGDSSRSQDTFHEEGQSSVSEDDEVQKCKSELATAFKRLNYDYAMNINHYITLTTDDSGINNFLHALLNLNTESFRNNEQGLKKKYYDDMFKSLRNMNIPPLMHPERYCNVYHINGEFACISALERILCRPYVDGLDCLKHMYLAWKDKDESILGTKHFSNDELIKAIYAKKSYPDPESVDEELKKAFYDEFQIEYVTHENLCAEYTRRDKQRESYERAYAIFLYEEVKMIDRERSQKNGTGSAFKNCQEFCDYYFS